MRILRSRTRPNHRRAAIGAGALAVVSLLHGCTGAANAPEQTSGTSSSGDAVNRQDWTGLVGRDAVRPQVVRAADLERAPWARGYRLPRRPPPPADKVPRLLDDLPGRAVMTYYAEPSHLAGFAGSPYPTAWDRETIYFLGDDLRWRVLPMTDLGLADSAWYGTDNYGAGSLSPDGRWWGTTSMNGSVVLDLRTGRVHRARVPRVGPDATGAGVIYSWTSDSSRVHVEDTGTGPGVWIEAPEFDRAAPAPERAIPHASGYAESHNQPGRLPYQADPPLTFRFFDDSGRLRAERVVGASLLGKPFRDRQGGPGAFVYGFLDGVEDPDGDLGLRSVHAWTKREYLQELAVVDITNGAVKARMRTDAMIRGHFDRDLWLLEPPQVQGSETYPGTRYLWSSTTGEVTKLAELAPRRSDARVYEFSYARDLIRER